MIQAAASALFGTYDEARWGFWPALLHGAPPQASTPTPPPPPPSPPKGGRGLPLPPFGGEGVGWGGGEGAYVHTSV